jgi:hypothetical protein
MIHPNLIGWWPFDGNFNDVSGCGKHGGNAGVTFVQDGTRSCANFAGGQYITLDPALFPGGNNPWTITAWIKFADLSVYNDWNMWLAWGSAFSKDQVVQLALNGASPPDVGFLYYYDDATVKSPITINELKNWHHHCWQHNSDSSNTYYLDGISIGTIDPKTLSLDQNVAANFGGSFERKWFYGSLKEVMAFNSFLPQSDILRIMTGQMPIAI